MIEQTIVTRCPDCNRNVIWHYHYAESTGTQQRTMSINAMYAKDKTNLITPGHYEQESHVCKEC
jgi:hypothetical protein